MFDEPYESSVCRKNAAPAWPDVAERLVHLPNSVVEEQDMYIELWISGLRLARASVSMAAVPLVRPEPGQAAAAARGAQRLVVEMVNRGHVVAWFCASALRSIRNSASAEAAAPAKPRQYAPEGDRSALYTTAPCRMVSPATTTEQESSPAPQSATAAAGGAEQLPPQPTTKPPLPRARPPPPTTPPPAPPAHRSPAPTTTTPPPPAAAAPASAAQPSQRLTIEL